MDILIPACWPQYLKILVPPHSLTSILDQDKLISWLIMVSMAHWVNQDIGSLKILLGFSEQ